jgi:hypothetical protein
MKRWREAGIFFAVQTFNYGAVAIYTRLVAQAAIVPAVSLDAVFAGVNYFVIRKIAKSDEDVLGFAAYVLGAAVGTLTGIWITLRMGH